MKKIFILALSVVATSLCAEIWMPAIFSYNICTLGYYAAQTAISSFTAPRGPLSPLGNAKGLAIVANYSVKMIWQYNFAYQSGIFY